MTSDNSHNNAAELTPDDHDRLISRIVDGEASGEDWDTFRAVAATDQDVWAELSETQRTNAVLSDALRGRAAIADTVELPSDFADPSHLQHRFDLVSRWGGWAAAAAIVLVWFTGGLPMGNNSGNQASIGPGISLANATPEQARDRYMDAGRAADSVIAELPDPVVVQTRVLEDGLVEVIFLRQILERKIVSQVLTQTRDDLGRPIAVPAQVQPTIDGSY
ncbi:MAG: hypothetical protein ACI89L_002165 [Phycisphaerales bacterium]|jgi:hypothetical protein